MLSESFMFAAIFLVVAGNARYAVAAYKGDIHPNIVSWVLWGVAPIVTFLVQQGDSAAMQRYLSLFAGITPLVIVAVALLKSHSSFKVSRLDIVCAAISIAAIVAWIFTKQGNLPILLSIAAGTAAGIPTAIKAFHKPYSENRTPFLFGAIAAIITLLTLTSLTFKTAAFAFYLVLSNCVIYGLIVARRKHHSMAHPATANS